MALERVVGDVLISCEPDARGAISQRWRSACGNFAQWRDEGLWDRLFTLVKWNRGAMLCIDSTYIRVQQSGADPAAASLQTMGQVGVDSRPR